MGVDARTACVPNACGRSIETNQSTGRSSGLRLVTALEQPSHRHSQRDRQQWRMVREPDRLQQRPCNGFTPFSLFIQTLLQVWNLSKRTTTYTAVRAGIQRTPPTGQGKSFCQFGVPRSWSPRQGRAIEVQTHRRARPCRRRKDRGTPLFGLQQMNCPDRQEFSAKSRVVSCLGAAAELSSD